MAHSAPVTPQPLSTNQVPHPDTQITPHPLTLLMTGCGGHSPIDPDPVGAEGQYIFFDAGVLKTKGNLVEGDALPGTAGTDFGVFGFRPSDTDGQEYGAPVFNNVTDMTNVARVYRTSDNAPFSYDNLVLWHPGAHDFYAFYPYDETVVTAAGLNADQQPYISYTQPQTLDGMYDLMTATAQDMLSGTTGSVSLVFGHRLYALSVKLKSESATPLVINSASLTFHNMISKANLFFDGSVAALDTEEKSYNLVSSEGTTVSAGGELAFIPADNPFLLVPDPDVPIELTFAMTFVNTWNENATYTLSQEVLEDLEAGYKYELVITRKDGNGTSVEFIPSLEKIVDTEGNSSWDVSVNTDHKFE